MILRKETETRQLGLEETPAEFIIRMNDTPQGDGNKKSIDIIKRIWYNK